jgi:peptidoglycan glycosyltransferase
LGENQAKEQLALMGITSTYVDYQGRDRIPAVFDTVAPYVVVSTLPAPGAWVPPDTTVVLGIRAP